MATESDKTQSSVTAQNAGHSTADYSATKAPENRPHVESTVPEEDTRMHPGGAHGAAANVGMETLPDDEDDVRRGE